jgi:histidyl-tRNA synthetase
MVHVVKLELPRGMRDLDSNDLDGINYVREKFIDSARLFNFTVMEPSPIETLDTLEAKAGPSISNEIYSMIDKGGRNIGLRFDLTIGLTRFVARRRDFKMPMKVGSFGGVWRYDEPQAGRYRYFHQCDIEIYGSHKVASDAEIIEFMYVFLKNLGLDISIEINHRLLVEEFVRKKLQISDDMLVSEIFRMMDKVPKKGSEAVLNEYRGKLNISVLEKLIAFSSVRGTIQEVSHNTDVTELENWRAIVEMMDLLESRHIKKSTINLGIVRGLDYYSGIVFEAYDSRSNVGALVGGGRYDRLTDAFERKQMGATGAAAGVERIILALRQRNLLQKPHSQIVYVAFTSEATKPKAMQIVSNLRNIGFATDYDLQDRSLRKQFDDASSKSASVVLVIAPKEIEQGLVIIKSLKTGKERKGNLKTLVEDLKTET